MIQLTAEGILESKARKGFIIKAVQEKEVVEYYAVIGVLDGFAAQLACPLLAEKDFADLDFYVDAMDLAIKNENFEMYRKQPGISRRETHASDILPLRKETAACSTD